MHIECNKKRNVGFRFAPEEFILPNECYQTKITNDFLSCLRWSRHVMLVDVCHTLPKSGVHLCTLGLTLWGNGVGHSPEERLNSSKLREKRTHVPNICCYAFPLYNTLTGSKAAGFDNE